MGRFIREFREFALKGNALDMAVGIILGAAFSTVINSIVNDIVMPPIGFILGGVDFSDLFFLIKEGTTAGPYHSLAAAKAAGAVTLNIGLFINSIISFGIIAFAVFMMVRSFNKIRVALDDKPATNEPTQKECPFCFSTISIKATRCPNCTSPLD